MSDCRYLYYLDDCFCLCLQELFSTIIINSTILAYSLCCYATVLLLRFAPFGCFKFISFYEMRKTIDFLILGDNFVHQRQIDTVFTSYLKSSVNAFCCPFAIWQHFIREICIALNHCLFKHTFCCSFSTSYCKSCSIFCLFCIVF